jgi:hypothetical protein
VDGAQAVAHPRSIATHPPAFGSSFVEFDLTNLKRPVPVAALAGSAGDEGRGQQKATQASTTTTETTKMTIKTIEAFTPHEHRKDRNDNDEHDQLNQQQQQDQQQQQQHPYKTLYVRVGVNDENNLFGRAGSPLVFSVVDVQARKVKLHVGLRGRQREAAPAAEIDRSIY